MKTIMTAAVLGLLSTSAFAAEFDINGSGAVIDLNSRANLNTTVGGHYGANGSSQFIVGNQSSGLISNKVSQSPDTSKLDVETSSISFEGVEIEGNISVPNASGFSSGFADLTGGAFSLEVDF